MAEIAYFVPGHPPPAPARWSPLQVYLPPMPAGVAAAYIEALTQPGDLIFDPFCQTPQIIREGTALGRRVLAANLNPVAAQAVELSLEWSNWPDPQALSAAFTRLTDSPRGNKTLRARMSEHYATRCPTCKKTAQLESLSWNRDQNEPIEKRVHCAQCNSDSRGPVDETDVALLKRYAARGLPYWLLLDRAVSAGADHSEERERAAAVLATYTPRALAAIADVLIQLDALSEADRATVHPLLLEALAVCSAIHPQETEGARSARPRSLKPPQHFIERNVWRAMEESLERLLRPPHQSTLTRTASLNALLNQQASGVCILAQGSRQVAQLLEAGQVALIIGMPPQPDPTFWALGAVWGAWLWGAAAAESLLPLLGRRRADMDWLWRGLSAALGAIASLLTEQRRLVLIQPTASNEWLAGLTLAGAGADLTLEHGQVEPHDGIRLVWKRKPAPATVRQLDLEALGIEIMDVAEQAALEVVRARGEPTPWIHLAAGIYRALGGRDLLGIAARLPEGTSPPLALLTNLVEGAFEGRETLLQRVEGEVDIWWLNRSTGKIGLPLSDLVEMAVYDALQQADEQPEAVLVHNIYRRFQGMLTPDRTLVSLCLDSYARRGSANLYTLRTEDRPELRQQEIEQLRRQVGALGVRLNWEVDEYDNNRVVWTERRVPVYTFLFSATAQLAPYLLTKRPPRGTPVLVIPGGRAGLIEYKLRTNIQFREAVTGAGWQFLKFRHLRTLAVDASLSRMRFQEALGLDPLIESRPQMTLL